MVRLDSVTVAVDAMSGDGGSDLNLEGCRQALQTDSELRLVLCGDSDALHSGSKAWDASLRDRMALRPAASVLPSDAGPALALRHGRDSSMAEALYAVHERVAQAAVSAGSTGALMVLARHVLGMLPGIERPALMGAIPGDRGLTWMLDLGANVQVDAERLCEFARLGHVALSSLNNRPPRTALLNIGSEPGKGPDAIREAGRMLSADPRIDYQGFIEADQVFDGVVDLVVCDGFSGNVLLKSAEGAIRLMFSQLKTSFAGSLCGYMARPRLRRLHDSLDPSRHNGAPLLGVRGTVIKSHGAATAGGLAHAITLAALEARRDLSAAMASQLWVAD
jgi:glycerol-3-phosphate acyltransferase PlsX